MSFVWGVNGGKGAARVSGGRRANPAAFEPPHAAALSPQPHPLPPTFSPLSPPLRSTITFFQQVGFASLELGSVRAKNTRNILLKVRRREREPKKEERRREREREGARIFSPSIPPLIFPVHARPPPPIQTLIDKLLSGIVYWAVGFALAYGDSVAGGLFGSTGWALAGRAASSPAGLAVWFESWAFLITATTIVSGCLAERAAFGAYLAYTPVMAGLVYPLAVHWTFHGWLNRALPVRGNEREKEKKMESERARNSDRKKREARSALSLSHTHHPLSPPSAPSSTLRAPPLSTCWAAWRAVT